MLSELNNRNQRYVKNKFVKCTAHIASAQIIWNRCYSHSRMKYIHKINSGLNIAECGSHENSQSDRFLCEKLTEFGVKCSFRYRCLCLLTTPSSPFFSPMKKNTDPYALPPFAEPSIGFINAKQRTYSLMNVIMFELNKNYVSRDICKGETWIQGTPDDLSSVLFNPAEATFVQNKGPKLTGRGKMKKWWFNFETIFQRGQWFQHSWLIYISLQYLSMLNCVR